jgi:DNA-directed RNA polymerase specialized sigma24 family protein
MLHDRGSAEDAVQEAAVRSWRKLGNLRPGTEMRPWFLAIVANQCRTMTRGRWWSVLRLDTPSGSVTAGFEDRVVQGADLRTALRKLAPQHAKCWSSITTSTAR